MSLSHNSNIWGPNNEDYQFYFHRCITYKNLVINKSGEYPNIEYIVMSNGKPIATYTSADLCKAFIDGFLSEEGYVLCPECRDEETQQQVIDFEELENVD